MGQNTAVIQIFVYYLLQLLVKNTHLAVRVSRSYSYSILVICAHSYVADMINASACMHIANVFSLKIDIHLVAVIRAPESYENINWIQKCLSGAKSVDSSA